MEKTTETNQPNENLVKLATLRDEIKLHIHLAAMDIKQEWNDKLEPKVLEAEQSARELTDASKHAVQDLVGKLEAFVKRVRPNAS